MEVTHTYKNVKELESKLGYDSIEMFIENFSVELELMDDMAEMKPWEELDIPEEDRVRFELARIPFKELSKAQKELGDEQKVLLS